MDKELTVSGRPDPQRPARSGYRPGPLPVVIIRRASRVVSHKQPGRTVYRGRKGLTGLERGGKGQVLILLGEAWVPPCVWDNIDLDYEELSEAFLGYEAILEDFSNNFSNGLWWFPETGCQPGHQGAAPPQVPRRDLDLDRSWDRRRAGSMLLFRHGSKLCWTSWCWF
jgi:hypothetical protein